MTEEESDRAADPAYRIGALRYGARRAYSLRGHWLIGTGGLLVALTGTFVLATFTMPSNWERWQKGLGFVGLSATVVAVIILMLVVAFALRAPYARFVAIADELEGNRRSLYEQSSAHSKLADEVAQLRERLVPQVLAASTPKPKALPRFEVRGIIQPDDEPWNFGILLRVNNEQNEPHSVDVRVSDISQVKRQDDFPWFVPWKDEVTTGKTIDGYDFGIARLAWISPEHISVQADDGGWDLYEESEIAFFRKSRNPLHKDPPASAYRGLTGPVTARVELRDGGGVRVWKGSVEIHLPEIGEGDPAVRVRENT